jgi:tetratricopeptide (TPR) repeat protein
MLDDLRQGDPAAAVARYENKYPDLLIDDPPVTNNYPAAIDIALLYQALGEQEKANRLLERSLAFLNSLPPGEFSHYSIFRARIHAMRGEKEEALAALRAAIDDGWTFQWWFHLKQDPAFDPVRNDPRFQAMVEEMSATMARQLAKVRQLEVSGEIALPPGS